MVSRTAVLVTAALLFGAPLAANGQGTPTHSRRQVALEKDAIERIEQVEEAARDVRYHATTIGQFITATDVSRWSHYHHLEEIKRAVNQDLRPALKRLYDIQKQLPEWKQDSIDKMIAAAEQLAADASSAMFAKVSNPLTPAALNDEYKQFVSNVTSHAEALLTTSDAAHAYAVAHVKAGEAGLTVGK